MAKTNIPLQIRPFAPSDESDVISLWQKCDLVVEQNDPQKDIAMKLHVQPELFLVGLVDNQIVATVMAGYEGHRGWINYLAVAPDHQSKGFARQIMAAVETKLKALGCPKINLQIRTTNKPVIEFYKSIGFKEDKVLSMGKRL